MKNKILFFICVLVFLTLGVVVYIKFFKVEDKPQNKENNKIEVNSNNLSLNIIDLDTIVKSNSTNYNIDVVNNITSYIKDNINFDEIEIGESNKIDAVSIINNEKYQECNGIVDIYKLNYGMYSYNIESNCNNDVEGSNKISFTILQNLNKIKEIYKIEEIDDGFLVLAYLLSDNEEKSSVLMKFDKNLILNWKIDITSDYFIDNTKYSIRVDKILTSSDGYYLLGYLNDEYGSVFGLKVSFDGKIIWKNKIDEDLILTSAVIDSNKLVIIDGNAIYLINDETGKVDRILAFDINDSKLKNYKKGKLTYHNNLYYVINARKMGEIVVFNNDGLLDRIIDSSKYFEEYQNTDIYVKNFEIIDEKILFIYSNDDILILDINGKYLSKRKNDKKTDAIIINSKYYSIISYNDLKYFDINQFNYNNDNIYQKSLLNIKNNNKNIFITKNHIYQYTYDSNTSSFIFARFDK